MKIFVRNYLYKASKASGIPALEEGKYPSDVTDFRYRQEKLAVSLNAGCTNLCIRYMKDMDSHENVSLSKYGYPNAEIVCSKKSQFCNCMKGLDAQRKEAQPSPAAVPPTMEELAELAKQQRREKVAAGKAAREIQALAGKKIAHELLSFNLQAWHLLGRNVNYNLHESEHRDETLDQYLHAIGEYLAGTLLPYTHDNPGQVLQVVNNELVKYGIPKVKLEGVRDNSEKTLMEVLGEDEPEYESVDVENAAWTPEEQLEPFDETAVVEDDGKWESEYPEGTAS